ncbi:hypothetical protein ABZW18_29410 [Streptomyces sp. NPDC004647]|uniref:hypothetical protein n=1 Tax=Streptomyces sp. NPDC004647 TaxID=3154671 RepID=UPI0033A90D4D
MVIVLILVFALVSGGALRTALDFTTGVLTLVSLTSAVVWGLIAADRVLLDIRQRLLSQGIHRALGVGSLGFLLLHITIKVADGHTSLIGALVPFGLGVQGSAGLIGLGSLAAYLMVIAGATGALRSAFTTTPGQAAGRWRTLHALAYPAWGSALLHGLNAGRPAAVWVVTMYSLSVLAVGAAVAVRLLPAPQRRRIARLLMTVTRPGALTTARDAPAPARDPSVAPLPGAGRFPAQRTGTSIEEPPLRLDSTPRPTPIATSRGAGISAAYRAVSAAPQPDPFGSAPTRSMPPVPSADPSTGSFPTVTQYGSSTDPLPPIPSYGAPTESLPPIPSYGAPYGDTESAPPVPSYGAPTESLPPIPSYGAPTESLPPIPSYGAPTESLPPIPSYGAPTEALPPIPSYAAPTESIPTVSPYPTQQPTQTSGRWPAPSPPPPAETVRRRVDPDAASGPPYPPPPGEPWHEPAGDRP